MNQSWDDKGGKSSLCHGHNLQSSKYSHQGKQYLGSESVGSATFGFLDPDSQKKYAGFTDPDLREKY